MKAAERSSGSSSSRSGLAFLVVTLILAAMLVTTMFLSLFFWAPHIVASLESGMILVVFDSPVTPPGFGVDRLDKVFWSWRGALWPTIRFGEFGHGGSIPLWMLIAPAAWASWWYYRRARRERLLGRCPKCEYDLTGNTSGVCPECGAPTGSGP